MLIIQLLIILVLRWESLLKRHLKATTHNPLPDMTRHHLIILSQAAYSSPLIPAVGDYLLKFLWSKEHLGLLHFAIDHAAFLDIRQFQIADWQVYEFFVGGNWACLGFIALFQEAGTSQPSWWRRQRHRNARQRFHVIALIKWLLLLMPGLAPPLAFGTNEAIIQLRWYFANVRLQSCKLIMWIKLTGLQCLPLPLIPAAI